MRRELFFPRCVQHEQGGVSLGMAVGLRGHRGRDQAVAVLHQRVA